MRAYILGAAALLASTSFVFADDIMAGYYGNTVIAKGTLGESHVHYKADHSFDGSGSSIMGKMDLKGTWTLDDKGQLCRTYDTPPPGVSNPLCTAWAAHKVGDSWSMMDRSITLVQGVQ
jgi:hypothetical protein